ncbi:hypothetical protein ACSMXM_01665 [Pacificimonas sp. ICDLI1SI03]
MTLPAPLRTTIRCLAAIILGYFVTAGTAALAAVLMVRFAGWDRTDAFVVAGSYSWIVWVACFMWAFAARQLWFMPLGMAIMATGTMAGAKAIEPYLPVLGAL